MYQHLLDKSDPLNDQVVRVTTGRKFKDVADEWEFHADNFLPYAPVTLDRLMALVQEVELPETKMALLNTISVIVERMEHHVCSQSDPFFLGLTKTDYALRKQCRLLASASMGTVGRGTFDEASHLNHTFSFDKCHESRVTVIPRLFPSHYPECYRA